ncbi:MAG TPA: FecR family protein [Terracidiphilus sp.]|jgi:hypothetical protein
MKTRLGILTAMLTGIVWLPVSAGAAERPSAALELTVEPVGQSFASAAAAGMVDGSGASPLGAETQAASDAPGAKLCADGTRAIDQGRWADAVKIFTEVASKHGDHADGALYWKAYAENKLGESKPSENTCAELRAGYPKSRWIEDCGALEVEIRARSGKPVQIKPEQSDDVKLLELNLMLQKDEPRALAEIQSILNGDSSEKLKKEAQFILGKHYSDATYAQIVRISYVEGDVRIERDDESGRANSGTWEKAVADLPVETGFSLVTGAGRAEIEFENASTIYLGENSVLTFNDLHTTAGVPYTELALLSGTVSLYFRPYVPWEKFILHTPTTDVTARYPDKSYARIQAFTDAVSITALAGGDVHLPGVPKDAAVAGRTWTYRQGTLLDAEGTVDNETFAAWDQWVKDRVTQRAAATAAVMAAAGLAEPIPGLADMQNQGKFFDCAPYGTCWEPKEIADQDEPGQQEQGSMRRPGQYPRFELAAYHPEGRFGQGMPVGMDEGFDFPCVPGSLRYRMQKDPATGRQTVADAGFAPHRSYDWAVCHAGTWIRRKKHYAWVAGGKRHHIDPVRWVKCGHQVAFVPLHPYDVKGQPAINARHEVFVVSRGKNEIRVQPVRFEPNLPIEYMKSPPKEFRSAAMRPLALADVPRMEAHSFTRLAGSRNTEISKAGVPIHFDLKSQSFMVGRQEMHGGRTTTAFAPMTNHSGTLQARGGSFSGGSGFHGGNSDSHGTSSASGGGSRGGGGGSSGGSHGSGGGGSSASSSGSAGSSSSGGSSGGGSHH